MKRSLVIQQQQYYADEGMWMGSQAQQQGCAFHEESRSSDNKRFPGMHMNRLGALAMDSDLSMLISMSKQHGKLGSMHMNRLGALAMDSDLSMLISMSKQHGHGRLGSIFQQGMHSDRKFPNNASYHISNASANSKFNSGGHSEYFSEEAYTEEHVGAVTESWLRWKK